MSVIVALSSDTEDISNIDKTINYLKTLKIHSSSDHEDIDYIIDWYSGIQSLLTNHSYSSQLMSA